MTGTVDMGAVVDRYVAAFEGRLANGDGGGPEWLRERSRAAIDRFAQVGFPTTRQEEWRFTDVRPIATTAFTLADAAAPSAVSARRLRAWLSPEADAPAAVFMNDRHVAALSHTSGLPGGVVVGSLRDALQSHAELVERHLGRHAADHANPFTALNTAFLEDGAFVYVPPDTELRLPLWLLFLSAARDAEVCHPRTLILLDRGARASVVETYAALSDGSYWVNAVTEIVVGDNAQLDAYRIQQEGLEAFHTATTQTYQERDSRCTAVAFAFGAALARHDIGVVLGGEGAECTLDGLSVLADRQHVDLHTTLDHARPHCTSWEVFNGVFADRARGVFNGRIIVRPGAQKTDSKQTNNNLLLSGRARADSQPQLEIYADDVRCTHGATLGPIDEKQLYYLQSRGLGRDAAVGLLTYGFCAEILRAMPCADLRRRIDRLVRQRLIDAGAARHPAE